jgi:mannose-6-phosphate isomerase-like protein (cupin superfamily)
MRSEPQRRHRKKVDPKSLKKHSDVVRDRGGDDSISMAGTRIATNTGYRIDGTKGAGFETFYEVMLPGTCGARVCHEKKDRALWIYAGQGFLETVVGEEQNLTTTRRLVPGDHVTLKKGTIYRISTTAKQQLGFVVTQSPKYESRLTTLEEPSATQEPTPADLAEPSEYERTRGVPGVNPRRGSKAAQQQQQVQGKRKKSLQIESFVPNEPARAGAGVSGINIRPSGGRFDESGAG